MTDADYVLHAYRKWGDDCVHHLLGDWAIVIWDAQEHRLFCAKDPMGWRQLYYAEHDGLLAVGSEPQQMFAGGWLPREVNEEYVLRFIAGALQEEGTTGHERVFDLDGGKVLTASDGSTVLSTFWSHPTPKKLGLGSPPEYVEAFIATFDAAVRARIRTNRKMGTYLSGGLDSSYVAAVAVGAGAELTGLSAYAPNTKWHDEREYSTLVANHLGIPQHLLDVSSCWSYSSEWLEPHMFDMPFHPAQGAQDVLLGRAARERDIGVVLGGEGGDEWMNGSEHFLAAAVARGKLGYAWRTARMNASRRQALRTIGVSAFEGLVPFPLQTATRRATGRVRPVQGLSQFVRPGMGWQPLMPQVRRALYWRSRDYQANDWMIYRQINKLEVSWRDRHEAAPNHVERRPPFFDLRVVELMASTPHWVKRYKGRRKDVLRDAISRVLPTEIAERRDWGLFDELFAKGARSEERARVEAALDAVSRSERVDGPGMRQELGTYLDAKHRWWWNTWCVIAAGLFLANAHASLRPIPARTPLVRGPQLNPEGRRGGFA
jgi:asparagine synthase (glutamine-hydrolysing)